METDEGLQVHRHGTDPSTARWWAGLCKEECRQSHAEASAKGLCEEGRDSVWGDGTESINGRAEGDEVDIPAGDLIIEM